MVSSHPFISKSSTPFTNPSVTVRKPPITIGITFTFIFHGFFNSLPRFRYLFFFSLSFNFTLRSAGTAIFIILQVLFFIIIIIIIIIHWELACGVLQVLLINFNIFSFVCFFLLKSEWQLVSSELDNSFKYPSWF